MAVKTAANSKRKSYANRVRALIISMFGLSKQDWIEQNKAWENWFTVENRDRNQHEVEALLRSDVKDAFKARVLAIVFAPRAEDVPFVGGEHHNSDLGLMIHESARFSALPTALRALAIALIGIYTSADKDCSRYWKQILDALSILSPEDPAAARLFKRYPLINIPHHPDDLPDCEPFNALLFSKTPEKWKRLADTKMRKIISVDEERQPTVGRSVIERYAYCIMTYPDNKPFPYGNDLFASQLDFLLRFPNLRGYFLFFQDHRMERVLERISGVAHRDLRYRFAKAFDTFEIDDAGGRSVAVMLLKEFGESDPELGEKLRSAIADADKYKRKQNAAARKRKARENAALDRMR